MFVKFFCMWLFIVKFLAKCVVVVHKLLNESRKTNSYLTFYCGSEQLFDIHCLPLLIVSVDALGCGVMCNKLNKCCNRTDVFCFI